MFRNNNEIAICSIVSKNYIPYTRTLFKSVSLYHQNVDRHVLLVDELANEFDKDKEPYVLIEAKDIGVPNFERMAFQYDVLEMNTAVKPFYIKYLFSLGYNKVIYFDPDIMLFNKMDDVFELLDKYSIILTPHITRPIPSDDTFRQNEQDNLNSGTFNLGFIAVSKTETTKEFIDWWSRKLQNQCFSEIETGLFVDQKWINLVPGLFDSVYILRNPGYNMAYWNLHERILSGRTVNKVYPLIFYHFSGINIDNLNIISKHQNRFTLEKRSDLIDIFNLYKEQLVLNGYYECKSWKYKYETYENGRVIGPIARRLYPYVFQKFSKPFSTAKGSYYDFLKHKNLLEKSATIIYSKNEIGQKAKIINIILKIILKLIGVDRYNALMKYIRYISVIRRQDFLVNEK